ncbi:serine hydrolase domain-containing protein [Streptococcus caprae]|uniref:Serine hydrolase domain-containing protein n=1 Tax=Streptococcus caprae TaxID=1640501 RepID=A0ABV8CX00_9STRE
MEAILEKIKEQIADNLYPGASLSIFDQGVWQEFYFGESEDGRATEPGLVYDLASVSKVVGVATLLIFLIQAGKLELDRALKSYYPQVEDSSLTIRQLLTHTSGIDPFIPNRDDLDETALKQAIHEIKVTDDKGFHYTDINFILLGFLLEKLLGQPLDQPLDVLFDERIFQKWGMAKTSFGPRLEAVPTVKGITTGQVHDPKAKVLGVHCGSAGLFSTIEDLKQFCQHYLEDDFASNLWQNYGSPDKPRSLGWNLDGDWIDHTGYTGPFVMVNRRAHQAVIFLTNRTYNYDDRPLWIAKRRELRDVIKESLR